MVKNALRTIEKTSVLTLTSQNRPATTKLQVCVGSDVVGKLCQKALMPQPNNKGKEEKVLATSAGGGHSLLFLCSFAVDDDPRDTINQNCWFGFAKISTRKGFS